MLVAFSSPVKFSKRDFLVWNFVQSFKLYYKLHVSQICFRCIIFVSCCASFEIRIFYRKLRRRKRGNPWSVFHRNSLKYIKKKLTTKQSQFQKKSIEFTYNFPWHFKVNEDKPALIIGDARVKRAKDWRLLQIRLRNWSTRWIPPDVGVWMRKFRPLPEPIRLQDLMNRSYTRWRHTLKIHNQASIARYFLKLSLPSCCFHVGILLIFTSLGISLL